jgi:hypothetical protein
MRTKKIGIILVFLTTCMAGFAQLNPVRNLVFRQWDNYQVICDCRSSNCFSISWNKPCSSSETLEGYAVYRNSVLFAFTTDTVVSCTGVTPCLHPGFFEKIFPCWVTVKAIYTTDSLKSGITDSIYVSNVAIGIKEHKQETFKVLKNPVKTGDNISLFIPSNESGKNTIKVFSPNGQLVKQYNMGNIAGSIINIPSTGLHRGICLIDLVLDNKTLTTKIVIQ